VCASPTAILLPPLHLKDDDDDKIISQLVVVVVAVRRFLQVKSFLAFFMEESCQSERASERAVGEVEVTKGSIFIIIVILMESTEKRAPPLNIDFVFEIYEFSEK